MYCQRAEFLLAKEQFELVPYLHFTSIFPYTQDMLTLHKATQEVRMIAKWTALAIAVITLIVLVTGLGKNIKEFFSPTPPPPPTVSFGKLPMPIFPKPATVLSLTYSLNTISGELPTFPDDRATVYKIKKPQINLLALQNAKQRVEEAGFTLPETRVSQTSYQWLKNSPPYTKLTLNIFSNNFDLASQYLTSATVAAALNVPDEQEAIDEAKSFLTSLSSIPDDIDEAKTTLFSIQDGQVLPATSLSTTKVIRVDFPQKSIDKLPIFYPHPPFSTMYFLIAAGIHQPEVVEGKFLHKEKSNDSATYPIKPAEQAFKELQEGSGYIASYYGQEKEVVIKDVYLAYYIDDKEDQEYLTPIVVFEGNNGFFAFIPAITNGWYNKSAF